MFAPSSSSSCSTEELEQKLRSHLAELDHPDYPWRLAKSSLGGRGVFASRDIAVNEIIFRDRTLIIGPRAAKFEFPTCIVCYKRVSLKDSCKNGCGLSVCSAAEGRKSCQDHERHREECELIRSWEPRKQLEGEVSMNILRSLTTIRGLLLMGNKMDILKVLQSNPCAQTVMEVERTVAEMNNFPKELKPTLYHISSVLNTNAFETKLSNELNSEEDSLRG